MFEYFAIATPASTTAASPLRTEVRLPIGTITRVGVEFPKGCAGLVHASIWGGARQIWPRSAEQSFATDGNDIDFLDEYEVKSGETQFFLVTWNLDDTYPHTLTFYFQISGPVAPLPAVVRAGRLQNLRNALMG